MSNNIKSPTQKQGNQVNSPCIPALPRVGHNIDWCINLIVPESYSTVARDRQSCQFYLLHLMLASLETLPKNAVTAKTL